MAGWERARDGVQKQCNVTLPDGTCSSVALRGGATIREVLRDLCHNMAVNMAAVDLFLVGGEKVSEGEVLISKSPLSNCYTERERVRERESERETYVNSLLLLLSNTVI